MKNIIWIVAVTWLLTAGSGVCEMNVEEGQWEVTVKMRMPGMQMEMPAVTNTMCINDENPVPHQADPGMDCKMLRQNVSANRAAWTVKCTGNGQNITSSGDITYKGDTFDGTVETKMDSTGQGKMTVKGKIQGKRIGACP